MREKMGKALFEGSSGRRLWSAALMLWLALALAAPMLPAPAYADDPATDGASLAIAGVDFMEPTAEGWELLRVDNAAGSTVYIDIAEGDRYLVRNMAYAIPGGADTPAAPGADYAGEGAQIAQIVAVQMKNEAGAASSPSSLLGNDPSSAPHYAITVRDAARQGEVLYAGTVYPVYAKLVDDDAVRYELLGIRTASASEVKIARNAGVGVTYYTNVDGSDAANRIAYKLDQVAGGSDVVFDQGLGAYVATYLRAEDQAVSGALKYVDVEGNVVRTVDVAEIAEEGTPVTFEKSFFVGNTYYRVVNNLIGTTVTLTPLQPTKQIRVVEVDGMQADAFQVHVEYVDGEGNLLWSDEVDVKGSGYQYTLPTTFSTKKQSGIELYTLEAVEGTPLDAAETGAAQTRTAQAWTNPVQLNAAARDALTRNDDGTYTLTAQYRGHDADKAVTLTIVEINGETGEVIGRVEKRVEEGLPATYTPENKTVDGVTLVPWSGNMESFTYEWADLQKGTDLLQYMYYVPEDYVPGDAYDITVQYMNVATSQVLRTQTLTIDPDIADFVTILGDERFVEGGNEYVRLDGQETAIRHAYFSPTRTYTVYYRDVNDILSAQITVQRTQIINTERVVTVPGATVVTAVPAVVTAGDGAPAAGDGAVPDDGAPAAAPVIDAGVGAGDGTTIINDDDNPLASPDGTTTSEERIEDEATALSAGADPAAEATQAVPAGAVAFGAAAVLLVLAALLVALRRKKKAAESRVIES